MAAVAFYKRARTMIRRKLQFGLIDEQPWDEATLKSLLKGIRSTVEPLG